LDDDFDSPAFLSRPTSPKKRATTPLPLAERLFTGIPLFHGNRAVLFDGTLPVSANPDPGAMVRWGWIRVNPLQPSSNLDQLTPKLRLLVIIDYKNQADLPIRDLLMKEYDVTALTLRHRQGAHITLVLVDEQGIWTTGAPEFGVVVSWMVE
jgi:hypothetical protein